MALRCSLLGCDYGDPDVDREREERGSEVVVTVQEYEECVRCGDRNVISENTEVTSLATGADDDAPVPPTSDAEPDLPNEQSAETTPTDADATDSDGELVDADDAAGDDAELIDADGDDADGIVITDAEADGESTDSSATTAEETDPATDDGEILENEPDEPRERDHGEWPDSEDVGPPADVADDSTSWPDDESVSAETASDDEPVTDDAVVLEHTEPDVDTAAPDDDTEIVDPSAESATEHPPQSGSGIERAEPVPTPGETGSSDDGGPTEFYCPRCDFVESNDRGSLRAGDICPDCRKGYLGERSTR